VVFPCANASRIPGMPGARSSNPPRHFPGWMYCRGDAPHPTQLLLLGRFFFGLLLYQLSGLVTYSAVPLSRAMWTTNLRTGCALDSSLLMMYSYA